MKPPQRRRAAPARYLGELTGPAAWSPREKRQLLRLLQAQRGRPEPDAFELARELPGRSEAEVGDFLQHLKGRVVREAIQRLHPGGQGPRSRAAQTPAPIEVWLDLVEKMTGPLEEALATAFSQVLTIAATEPTSLLHSKPSKPTKACGKPLLLSPAPGLPGSAPKTPGSAPKAPAESPTGPSAETALTVDFEKIYKYLSGSCRSGHSPELSAAESTVVLDLLLSLPEELSRLPCAALAEHMAEAYAYLTAPQPCPSGGSPGPGSRGLEEPNPLAPPTPGQAGPRELRSAWQVAGVCPLNPFLVPLELLGRVAPPDEVRGTSGT